MFNVVILTYNVLGNHLMQVFLAKHKQEDKFYAVKVLTKAAIRKRNEVCASHLSATDTRVISTMQNYKKLIKGI